MIHRHRPPRGAFFFATLALLGSLVTASAATLLPNGKQTFIDANGAPLALGTVQFYVPGTTTAKNTWQDAAQTILNTNPITLDISGQAVIYGAGCYRQIVKDKAGNTIWDQPTCDTSSSNPIWAGHSGGTANAQTLTASNFTSGDGQTIVFIAGLTNTGPLGLSINGGSSINVLRDTISGTFSLGGGEVYAGNLVQATYDATRGAFHLVNNPVLGSNPRSSLTASGTTDLGLATSRYVEVAGSATITSLGSSASLSFPLYTLLFDSVNTLVQSANLRLPGGANITTANGDYAVASYQGGSTWIVLDYATSGAPSSARQGITGEIRMFNLSACPSGWLTADGTNGTPDMRGRFARGLDLGAGVDAGRALASYQADTLKDHTHSYSAPLFTPAGGGGSAQNVYQNQTTTTTGSINSAGDGGGTETRPKNIALLFCQKS